MSARSLRLLGALIFLLAVPSLSAATIYTSDPNLGDLITGWTNFATILTGLPVAQYLSDVAVPYTPTAVTLAVGNRVVGNGSVPFIITEFSAPVSTIRVFPNIDHPAPWDRFQYSIYGSNDGVNYSPLFDPLTVAGSGDPYTLGSYTGTAPTSVNNVLSPGAGRQGTVGYVADFTFGQAYRWYAFGMSTATISGGNVEQEISAVASPSGSSGPDPAPEPATLLTGSLGFAVLALTHRCYGKRRKI